MIVTLILVYIPVKLAGSNAESRTRLLRLKSSQLSVS